MKIKIVNRSPHPLPHYQTRHAAGMDIHAFTEDDIELMPLQRQLIPTGLFIELPPGYEAQVRPRSGLAFRHGIAVLNAPGTIDADYRGEIKVILINLSTERFVIKDGERIAQLIIARHETIQWEQVEVLNISGRESAGFGSTGK
ncbi:MAG: dUTP diphosphatase [Cyclobacteriaceae bacterium]|nr:dUTP diphosphatase [Cyclobacteriaceae bacterium]